MSEKAVTARGIPRGFVPQNYEGQSRTEVTMLGQFLKPGMIVLLKSGRQRGNPDRYASGTPHMRESLLQKARWCRIESLTPAQQGSYVLTFMGIYADGARYRTTSPLSEWIVKKSSLP